MKNMVSIVFLALTLAAGGASAQATGGEQSRVVSSVGQGPLDGEIDCDEVGSGLWDCWECEEDKEGLQTSCITWEGDNDGWELFRRTTRFDVANKP